MKNRIVFVLITAFALFVGSCKKNEEPAPAGINFSVTEESGYEFKNSGAFGKIHTVKIDMGRSLSSDVVIGYAFSGTATKGFGADYNYTVSEATIPAGETSADINFTVFDNTTYQGEDRTIIINLTSVSNSKAKLGSNKSYTYTLMDDELKIDLTWSSSTKVDDDFNLDLYWYDNHDNIVDESSASSGFETIVINGTLTNDLYYVTVKQTLGAGLGTQADYVVTLSSPDGTETSATGTFSPANQNPKTLFQVLKDGASYTITPL